MFVRHGEEPNIPLHHRQDKPGAWLPADRRIHNEYLKRIATTVDKDPANKLLPALEEFKSFIESTPRVNMYFSQMFDEIPHRRPFSKDPTGNKQIRDCNHMLQVLNKILCHAPGWTDAAAGVGLVGVPINALLDYPMGTPSGHAAFLDPEVNKHLKKVLNEWGCFLQTPESANVLNEGRLGWFGSTATKDIMAVANAPYGTDYKFEDMFHRDPTAKHHGYKSWDDFFTRKVKDSARPVAFPNDDSVIVNACESRVYNIERNVAFKDRFFAKGQPYSICDMLDHDESASYFEGGTVYQAFLSALSYHRWHSPVSGTIRRAFVKDGTYFSEPLLTLANGTTTIAQDGLSDSQGYLSALATRAIIIIKADNSNIGLVGFVGIGMDEVSTCDITVQEGQHIKKGDELGMFHFGGSSHCLLFRNGLQLDELPSVGGKDNVPVRGKLAVVRS